METWQILALVGIVGQLIINASLALSTSSHRKTLKAQSERLDIQFRTIEIISRHLDTTDRAIDRLDTQIDATSTDHDDLDEEVREIREMLSKD